MKLFRLFLILVSLFLFSTCKKENSGGDEIAVSGSANNVTASVAGIVLDENNLPVKFVEVIAGTGVAMTDADGLFILKDVSVDEDRCRLQLSKTGYMSRIHSLKVTEGVVNYVRIVLLHSATTHYMNSSGGIVSLPDGSSIDFPSDAFATASGSLYTGNVTLSFKHLSPDDANFGFTVPGGDLRGKNTAGEDVALYTYGMLGLEMKGASGINIRLADGVSATLTMPIAASQQGNAPATIPLWYFDEATALWKEEGSAVKTGNSYTGSVNHFSWWNFDQPCNVAGISGRVLDCNGAPLANIVVTLNGWATLLTNQNGYYNSWVPAGLAMTIQVLAANNNSIVLNSQLENIPPLGVNVIWIVPDLIVDCPSEIAGKLKSCSGQFSDGLVRVSWNSGSVFQYTTGGQEGAFALPCPPSAQVTLTAYNQVNAALLSFTDQYQSLSAGNTLNVGELLLCDSMTEIHVNNVTIDGGPFSNYLMNMVNIYQSNVIVETGGVEIFCYGTTGAYTLTMSINFPDTLTGSYPFTTSIGHSFPYLYFQNGVDTFSASTFGMYSGPGTLHLLQWGPPGTRIIGHFSGIETLNPAGAGQYPAMVTGNFDVLRQ